MKKSSIPVFLLIVTLVGFGCEKKTDNATTDSTMQSPSDTTMKMMSAASPAGGTSLISPPGVGNPGNPINITMGNNSITFSGTINGPTKQTVNVNDGSGNPTSFTGNKGYNWNYTSTVAKGTLISVTTVITPGQYASSPSNPLDAGPNKTGYDQTTYSDTVGDQSIITIQENGIVNAAGGKK